MSWLEDLLGIKDLWRDGNLLSPRRKALEFVSGVGIALALTDDPATGRSKLEISAAGGGSSGSSDYRESVRAATTGALPAYTRVGNVLTANANGALPAQDGVTLTVGTRRLLLWHGASGIDNGTYDVTQLGDGSSPWILTRTQDALGNTETFTDGTRVPIAEGTLYAGRTFKVTTNDPIVLNTTAISWALDTGLPDGTVADQIPKWNGTTWIAGALNLAAAAAVTGILGLANGGTGLSATPAANTVLTGTGAAAAWSDAPTVASLSASSYLAVGAGTKATAGDIRFDSAWSIQQRNAEPGTIDRNVLSGTGESWDLGDAAQSGQGYVRASYLNLLGQGGVYSKATTFFVQTAAGGACFEFSPNTAAFTVTATTLSPVISQSDHATTGHTFTVQAQNVTTGTGSTLLLKAGTGSVANGVVQIGYGATVTAQFGANAAFFAATGSYGGGVNVIFGGSVATTPTTAPSGGGLIYWDADGNIFGVNEAGVHSQLN